MLWACTDTVSEAVPEAGEEGRLVELHFNVYMPEQEMVQTRTAEDVTDLYLLVFDENNRFLSKNKAILGGTSTKDGVVVREFSVVLLSSDEPRTIHFIANYPNWDKFPTSHELRGKDEGYIIPPMESQETTYWNRTELPNIEDENAFNGKIYPLLRNRAKIKIEVTNEIENQLKLTGMALYNAPAWGTIAPFVYNNASQKYEFKKGSLTPSLKSEVLDADMQDYSSINSNSFDVFEKQNEGVDNPSFIILKGKYGGQTNECYYKIVLVKDESKGTLYDFMRNTHYKVKLMKVSSAGYNSLEEAVAGPPSNNIFASTELQDYPTISDGKAILKVDKLGEVFVRKSETFEAQIDYYPNKNKDDTTPDAIEVICNEAESKTYFDFPYDKSTGKLTVIVKQIPELEVKTFKLIVKTKEDENNNLLRYITLVFRSPYNFNATATAAGNSQGDSVTVSFDIPGTMMSSIFPFQVKISSNDISPDPSQEDLNIGFDQPNYFFTYNVRETSRGERVDLKFKRTLDANASKIITLQSRYFDEVKVPLLLR